MKLDQRSQPRIGLVWSTSGKYKSGYDKSIFLSQMLPFLPSGPDYICLQNELRELDREVLTRFGRIRYFGELID